MFCPVCSSVVYCAFLSGYGLDDGIAGLTCVILGGMKYSCTKIWIFDLVLNLTMFSLLTHRDIG